MICMCPILYPYLCEVWKWMKKEEKEVHEHWTMNIQRMTSYSYMIYVYSLWTFYVQILHRNWMLTKKIQLEACQGDKRLDVLITKWFISENIIMFTYLTWLVSLFDYSDMISVLYTKWSIFETIHNTFCRLLLHTAVHSILYKITRFPNNWRPC